MNEFINIFVLKFFKDSLGKVPFLHWLDSLKDRVTRMKIKVRLDRLERGNFGNHRSVGEGVYELKIDFGPGYRVYYGVYEKNIIVLLWGGDKSSQSKDICRAHEYWSSFLEVS